MIRDIFGRSGRSAETGIPGYEAPLDTGPRIVEVLVADIDGVAGRDITLQLGDGLGACPGLGVRMARRKLRLSGDGSFVDKLALAGSTGRSWLAREGADVLIWGESLGTEGAAMIRFLPAALDGEARTGTFGLGDYLELPAGFGPEYAEIAAASALAAAVPVKPNEGEALTRVLAAALGRISGYVEAPPPGLSVTQLVSMLTCLGNGFASLWRVGGEDAHLDRALRVYDLALQNCPLAGMSIPHALIQNHLAATYEAKAGGDSGTEALEAAAKAYTAVTEIMNTEDHRHDWAFAQNRLGMIHYRLAMRRDGNAGHLKSSVRALEMARLVFTRDDSPDRWAEITNQIGVALMALGTQVAGNEALERSVTAFREALEIRHREAAPLLWAQTANNLGAASFALFRRTDKRDLLEEAVRRFEEAHAVYSRFKQQRTVTVIEKNLHRARSLMGRR